MYCTESKYKVGSKFYYHHDSELYVISKVNERGANGYSYEIRSASSNAIVASWLSHSNLKAHAKFLPEGELTDVLYV